MNKILITGLNGVIGWNLFRVASLRFDTHGTYRKPIPEFSGPSFHRLDLLDAGELAALLKKIKPKYLIHSWAMCDLDLCEMFPQMAHQINIEGTRVLIEAIHRTEGLEKLIYISTDHVFDGKRGGYTEQDEPSPMHVYGKTKREAELLIQAAGLTYAIIRPGLIIGPSVQGNKGPRDFLFHRIRSRKPIHYFVDEWRSPIRAEDFAQSVLEITLDPQRRGIFHIASDRIQNRYELACELARDQGLSSEHIFPRFRREDRWAHIRPENLSLKTAN